MPRRSWLPDGVTEYKDRHGKARYRFRKAGYVAYHFRSQPGTEAFRVEYANALENMLDKRKAAKDRVIPGSIDDLCVRYYSTAAWKAMAPNSQTTYRGIIERFRARTKASGLRYGSLPAASITTANLDAILGGEIVADDGAGICHHRRFICARVVAFWVRQASKRIRLASACARSVSLSRAAFSQSAQASS